MPYRDLPLDSGFMRIAKRAVCALMLDVMLDVFEQPELPRLGFNIISRWLQLDSDLNAVNFATG